MFMAGFAVYTSTDTFNILNVESCMRIQLFSTKPDIIEIGKNAKRCHLSHYIYWVGWRCSLYIYVYIKVCLLLFKNTIF